MTTFWISFSNPEASTAERFLGVAIFDMDESDGQTSRVRRQDNARRYRMARV